MKSKRIPVSDVYIVVATPLALHVLRASRVTDEDGVDQVQATPVPAGEQSIGMLWTRSLQMEFEALVAKSFDVPILNIPPPVGQ